MQLPPDSVIEERLGKTFPDTRLREQPSERFTAKFTVSVIDRCA